MEAKRKAGFGAWFATFILCYFFWILLTGSFAWQELVVGAVVSAGVALFSARWFVHEEPGRFFGKRLFILIWYCVGVFPWELGALSRLSCASTPASSACPWTCRPNTARPCSQTP